MSMRVLVFCSVLLHAAVCEEHCDSLDATGNANFNEGNELLQVNADHGSSHDSVSSGVCSIKVGNCAKVTTSTSYNPKRAFRGQILKVGRKTAYNDCILVSMDGLNIGNLMGMGFADSELEPAPCVRKPTVNELVRNKEKIRAAALAKATSESNRPQRAPVPTAAEQAVSDATKEEERAARDAATAVAVSQDAVAAEARTVHDVAVTSQAAQKAAAQSKINEAGKGRANTVPAIPARKARARAKGFNPFPAQKAAAQSKINEAGKGRANTVPAIPARKARARAKGFNPFPAQKAAAQSKINEAQKVAAQKVAAQKVKQDRMDRSRAASTRAWRKIGA